MQRTQYARLTVAILVKKRLPVLGMQDDPQKKKIVLLKGVPWEKYLCTWVTSFAISFRQHLPSPGISGHP